MKIYVIQEDPGDYGYDDETKEEYWVSDKRPLIAFTTWDAAQQYLNNEKLASDICFEIHEIELKTVKYSK
jgi:hypothetical protein